MQSVEELEQELTESEAHTEALEQSLAGSRVANLTDLVSKAGKMRGHLTGVTPKQYERVIGRKPPPDLLVKARDATTRKVQWDMVLDQLASERGYKSDEELRDAIESAHSDKQAIEEAKAAQRVLRSEIIDRMKAEPGVETIKLDDQCPQFPEDICTAEVTLVNGMKFTLRRQHSYWRIDTDKGKIIKIRYAKDARKLARKATKIYKEEVTGARAMKATEREALIKKGRKERRALLQRGREERQALLEKGRKERQLKYQTVSPEPGTPEAGYQPSMVEGVPEKEVRPKGKSKVVQISMADQLKLEQVKQEAKTMAAKYGVSIMCTTKKRAEQMAGEVRKGGYGALVEENIGPSKDEYPYLVRRTNAPLKRPKTKKMPMLRR